MPSAGCHFAQPPALGVRCSSFVGASCSGFSGPLPKEKVPPSSKVPATLRRCKLAVDGVKSGFAIHDAGGHAFGDSNSGRLLDKRLNEWVQSLIGPRASAAGQRINVDNCCTFNALAISLLSLGLLSPKTGPEPTSGTALAAGSPTSPLTAASVRGAAV
jgi:hypothetical protein